MPEHYAEYSGHTSDRRSGLDRRERPPIDHGYPVDGSTPRRWHHLAMWVQFEPGHAPSPTVIIEALAAAGITAVDGIQLRPVPG